MNAVLCCYDWDSIRGYTYAYADTKQRRVFSYTQAQKQFPDAIMRLLGNGGAYLACGFDEQTENYFLVLKGINVGKKDIDGRGTDACIAFLSPDAEEISLFTKGLLTQYIAVETAFQKLLTPDVSNTVGYGIDFELFTNVIESCIALGKEPDTRPIWENNIRFTRIKPLSFVVTESGLPYFLKMIRVASSDVMSYVDASGKKFSAFLQNTRAVLFPVKPIIIENPKPDTSKQNNLCELEKRVAELENKQRQAPPPQTDDSEIHKVRDEHEWIKQDTKNQEKKSRVFLLIILIISVLSLILSIIAISKKGDKETWQTSYTDSMLQSSDTQQT